MKRVLFSVPAVLLTVILTSCSSGSGTSGGGGGTSLFVPGKWTIELFPSANGVIGNTSEVDMNLVQSGNTISSDAENTVDSAFCTGNAPHVDLTTGTVNGDQFNLIITIDSETVTLNGTLVANGESIAVANTKLTSSPNGPCFNGESGGFSGNFIPPLTGTFTGDLNVIGLTVSPPVNATLTENATFNVTGSMMVTGAPCFSSIETETGNPGLSIGGVSSFEMSDGANLVSFVGKVESTPGSGLPAEYDANFSVLAGCTEESGELSLSFPTSDEAQASNSRMATPRISPLLAERIKRVAANRRDNPN